MLKCVEVLKSIHKTRIKHKILPLHSQYSSDCSMQFHLVYVITNSK